MRQHDEPTGPPTEIRWLAGVAISVMFVALVVLVWVSWGSYHAHERPLLQQAPQAARLLHD